MKHIEVAAAVLVEEGRVFAAQRGDEGPLGGKWEFPGGKLEAEESPGSAVVRELLEELHTTVEVIKPLLTVNHTYPTFSITLHGLLCRRLSGELILTEHQRATWVTKEQLYTLDWAAADIPIVDVVARLLSE